MQRQIVATLYRGKKKEIVWVRRYNWMDTAMPRVLQLSMQTGSAGDVVEFASTELGFQIGILRVMPKSKMELEISELIKHSPTLMKLVNGSIRQGNLS